ncbi:hypothetical protein LWI28_006576 [Acer negundo]|uniref:Uncharacterized protein n=1 Tax=Acer negundo TaxID=4023 RepID=A0AAD5JIL1_ACENE|nr:hypothetical protein LWI28_006576 [Acer negundo]
MRLWKLSNLMSRWMKIPKALKHMVCMPKEKSGVGRRAGMINLATGVDKNPREKKKRTRVVLHVVLLTTGKRIGRYGKKGKQRRCQGIQVQPMWLLQMKVAENSLRALDIVRHIPKLKKNLISLGNLDKAGYKYCSERGIFKVIKGLLIMMRGDIQTNTLYKLQGTTIVGRAAISVEKDETEL